MFKKKCLRKLYKNFKSTFLCDHIYSAQNETMAAISFRRAAVRHKVRQRTHYGDTSGAAMEQSHAREHSWAAESSSHFEPSIVQYFVIMRRKYL